MSDDDIQDRYAARLGGDDSGDDHPEKSGNADPTAETDQTAMSAENDTPVKSSQNVWNAQNVKNEWKGWTVYLPPEYLEDVKNQGKLLDVHLDRDVKLDRHYKPLLIALGMDQLERMESNEISAFLERMEQGELNE